jgi:hypothetical protein
VNTIHRRVTQTVSRFLTRARRSDDDDLFREMTNTAKAAPGMLHSYINLVGTAWFLLAFACTCVMVAAAFVTEHVVGQGAAHALTGVTYGAVAFCIAGGIVVQWYRLPLWLAARRGVFAENGKRLPAAVLPTNRTIPIQLIVAIAAALQTWLGHWTPGS